MHNQDTHNKLRTYRLFKTEPKTENYVKNKHMHGEDRRSLAQFRCGSAPLKAGLLRYKRLQLPKICRGTEIVRMNSNNPRSPLETNYR